MTKINTSQMLRFCSKFRIPTRTHRTRAYAIDTFISGSSALNVETLANIMRRGNRQIYLDIGSKKVHFRIKNLWADGDITLWNKGTNIDFHMTSPKREIGKVKIELAANCHDMEFVIEQYTDPLKKLVEGKHPYYIQVKIFNDAKYHIRTPAGFFDSPKLMDPAILCTTSFYVSWNKDGLIPIYG